MPLPEEMVVLMNYGKVLSILEIIHLARNFTVLLVDDPGSR